jgi:hypothetical protein
MAYWLIAVDEKLPPLPLLAQAMGAGLDLSSAAIAARHCWGVLGSVPEEADAAGLESRCAGLGIKTLRLPAPGPLPVPQPSKKVVFSGGTASFSLEGGAEMTVRPEDLAVIAAAPVKESFFRTVKTTEGPSAQEKAVRFGIMAVTGLPIGLGKTKEVTKEVKSTELSFYMDLVLKGGATRLRLTSGNFDFSGLKEKKTYSSQVNFRLLCAELAAFAPGAWKNSGLHAMLEGRPLSTLPYDSLDDLEKETLRLVLAAPTAR